MDARDDDSDLSDDDVQHDRPTVATYVVGLPVTPDTGEGTSKGSNAPGDPYVYDVGDIVSGKVTRESLSSIAKTKYLTEHYQPINFDSLCSQVITRKSEKRTYTLSFQKEWLQRDGDFPWLVYSQTLNGGMCKYCVLFPPKDERIKTGVLVTKPFTNLKKATGKDGIYVSHANLNFHKNAVHAGREFLRTVANPTQTLEYQISNLNRQLYDKNMHILSAVVEVVLLCGRQDIPLRGHRDDNSDSCSDVSNKGNFLAILESKAKSDPILRDHLDNGKRNARCTSKTIQNELIDIIGGLIRERLTLPLKEKDSFFTIIGDEVTHTNQEILSICLRFLDTLSTNPEVKEVFFDFVNLKRTTGEAIGNAIINCLAKHGIDIRKARGQSYDGASCMSSARVGTQAQIKAVAPLALYTHCNSHVLNLSIAAACKAQLVRNMIGTVNELFLFFGNSPKRQRYFEKIISEEENKASVTKLKGLCKTRWIERHTCYETLQELFPCVCKCLDRILVPDEALDADEDWSWDRDTCTKANGLLSVITSFEFVVVFIVTKNGLHPLKGMAKKLQTNGLDVMEAYASIDGKVSAIAQMRHEVEKEFRDWYDMAESLVESVGGEVKMPRIAKRQVHRENIAAENPFDYYMRNLAIPFLDHLSQEMETRFTVENRAGSALFNLMPSASCKVTDIPALTEQLFMWKDDLPFPTSLNNELKDWISFWTDKQDKPGTFLDCFKVTDSDEFPNIRVLLHLGCTLPVGSCEAERSFSCLRRIKTFLRTTMGQDRLASCSLMSLHHSLSLSLSTKDVCDRFIRLHKRRMFANSVVFE